MKFTLSIFILIFSFNNYTQANASDTISQKITADDLKIVVGDWTGSITYLDYKTNKPFTMSANLIVKQGKNKNQLLLNNIYPREPKANNTDKIKVNKNGTMLNKSVVTSREELANGQIQIITELAGKDDNKKALIRRTYIMGKDQFIIRKDVQFEGSKDWIKRSEFKYKRQN